jgi:Retinoblastoma-associated protein A domain/Domain of unknown function (DUF3452)/Retinoblastoma-associated protein B domain
VCVFFFFFFFPAKCFFKKKKRFFIFLFFLKMKMHKTIKNIVAIAKERMKAERKGDGEDGDAISEEETSLWHVCAKFLALAPQLSEYRVGGIWQQTLATMDDDDEEEEEEEEEEDFKQKDVANNDDDESFCLGAMLRAEQISYGQFFDALKKILPLLQLSKEFKECVRQLEDHFVIVSILWRKYCELYVHFVCDDATKKTTTKDDEREHQKEKQVGDDDDDDALACVGHDINALVARLKASDSLFKFGWHLFVYIKATLELDDAKNLLSGWYLLLCSLNYLMVHSSAARRGDQLRGDENRVRALQALVNDPQCHCEGIIDEVTRLDADVFAPVVQSLARNGCLQPCSCGDAQCLDDRLVLDRNVANLTAQYRRVAPIVDEHAFLESSQRFDFAGSASGVSSRSRGFFGLHTPQARTPTSRLSSSSSASSSSSLLPPPPTPMSEARVTISWLKKSLASGGETFPSDTLVAEMERAGATVRQSIEVRLDELTAFADAAQLRSRRQWVSKLYYKTLCDMIGAEKERLAKSGRQANFEALLRNDTFHRAMIACCIELVAYCFKLPKYASPYAVRLCQFHPFELPKLLDSIVRHLPGLPDAGRRHLNEVERNVLLAGGWERRSPVFALVVEPGARPHLLAKFVPGAAAAAPNPSAADNQRFFALELFFRKVFRLAEARVRALVGVPLNLSAPVVAKVLESLHRVVILHTDLLRDRHLDQIIMCTVFGVCRANLTMQPELGRTTFMAIVDRYRELYKDATRVFTQIPLSDDAQFPPLGNIIHFHNSVFVPQVNALLRQHATVVATLQRTASGSALPSLVPPKSPLLRNAHVFVSPMKAHPFSRPPRSPAPSPSTMAPTMPAAAATATTATTMRSPASRKRASAGGSLRVISAGASPPLTHAAALDKADRPDASPVITTFIGKSPRAKYVELNQNVNRFDNTKRRRRLDFNPNEDEDEEEHANIGGIVSTLSKRKQEIDAIDDDDEERHVSKRQRTSRSVAANALQSLSSSGSSSE